MITFKHFTIACSIIMGTFVVAIVYNKLFPDIVYNVSVDIVNGKEILYVGDSLRIEPKDHRFDKIGDVVYVLQREVDDTWIGLDSIRGKRFRRAGKMVHYFMRRESCKAKGDSTLFYRLFNEFREEERIRYDIHD